MNGWNDGDERDWIMAAILGIVCGAAAVYVARRLLRGGRDDVSERDVVDVATDDSFPASDPPSWTTGRH